MIRTLGYILWLDFSCKMKVNPRIKDYDPVKASLFNSFTTVSAILLLMNSVFNVMVYTTRNKNFKGTCFLHVWSTFACDICKCNNSKHEWDEMIALLTCRRRALKLKQRRSKYRIQLSSSSSPDTSEAWHCQVDRIFLQYFVYIYNYIK